MLNMRDAGLVLSVYGLVRLFDLAFDYHPLLPWSYYAAEISLGFLIFALERRRIACGGNG